MPTYHFHVAHNGLSLDREGTDYRDDTAARCAAIMFGGELMRDKPDRVWDGRDFRVEVTDQDNDLLFTVIMLSVDAPASR